ncbi:hypothetical protein Calhy_2570 [Caldicellulosiruptor hydrothermalis 108]|uniref:Uncharacterized protein n=1 Tax=Caldicellulosiruptor hydrothermalis (strain DSM 18901 / VKM B-2411 / 108) TaxID=632292 RepID=E4QAF6_CALH1|nr:hypothetical protein Calhy_2570 [Caldicellulosiruptor hydrothermalis 108]
MVIAVIILIILAPILLPLILISLGILYLMFRFILGIIKGFFRI